MEANSPNTTPKPEPKKGFWKRLGGGILEFIAQIVYQSQRNQ